MNDVEPSYDGRIVAVSVSLKKGVKKTNILLGNLIENYGWKTTPMPVIGIARSAFWRLCIAKIQRKGLHVNPGDFAENITTEGIKLWELPVGTRLKLEETHWLRSPRSARSAMTAAPYINRWEIVSCPERESL